MYNVLYVYVVWMGGAGGFGDGLPMVAGLVSRICLYMKGVKINND